jgi:predicted metalloendopeptidase
MLNTLPPDVIDLLLSSSPDLRSLAAFTRVSKRIYRVYQARFRSIRTAVAVNEVGDAFPQAIRLARLQIEYHNETLVMEKDDVEKYLLEVPDETNLDLTVADWNEATTLSKNAQILKEFELFYSRRCAYAMSLSCVEYIKCYEDIRTVRRSAQLYPATNHCV